MSDREQNMYHMVVRYDVLYTKTLLYRLKHNVLMFWGGGGEKKGWELGCNVILYNCIQWPFGPAPPPCLGMGGWVGACVSFILRRPSTFDYTCTRTRTRTHVRARAHTHVYCRNMRTTSNCAIVLGTHTLSKSPDDTRMGFISTTKSARRVMGIVTNN